MGFFSKVKKAAKKVTAPVRSVGRMIDPTSSRSLVGGVLPSGVRSVIRQGAATAAVGLTGGAALLSSRVRDPAIKGYALGAAVGATVAGSSALASAADMAGGLAANLTAPDLQKPEPDTAAQPVPVATSGKDLSGAAAVAAGAAGFAIAGPLGLAAAIPAYLLTKK